MPHDKKPKGRYQLSNRHYLPVARFTVKESREDGFLSTTLKVPENCRKIKRFRIGSELQN